MIIYKIYLYNNDVIPEKYIDNITKYEHLLDIDYYNWHNLPSEDLLQNNYNMFQYQRKSRRYNYILAIDDTIDEVIGTLVFILPSESNNPQSYFDSIAKKNIFFAYFYIDEQYRNLGIGTIMLNILSEYIKNAGCSALQMKVDIPNKNAYRFYERLGYKPLFSEMHLNTFDTGVIPAKEYELNSYICDRIKNSIINKLSLFNNNYTLNEILKHICYRFDSNQMKCANIDDNYMIYHTNGYGFNNIDDIFANNNDLITYNKIIRAFNALSRANDISRIIIEVPYNEVPFFKKLNFFEAITNMIKKFCNETIIENEHLPEITSSSIRQSNGLYDPRGLFSTEFFGAERSRKWNTMFGKLVIPHPVIHPAIYYIIKRNISYLLRWIKLDIGFVQEDNQLILTNVSNNYKFAGIVDLYQNSRLICDALIKTKKFETETARKILGYIVQRNIPIFTSNVIVMPPGYRPVNGDARASSSNDNTDDNKNYIKLIDEINILKSAMQSKDKMLINRILISIQEYYAILFDSMVNKCKGKTGLIRSQILSKNADFSGRAVIVVDPLIRPSQIGVPRNMLIKLFYPWIIHFINNNNEYKSALKQCGVEPNISNMYNIINSNLFEKKIEN